MGVLSTAIKAGASILGGVLGKSETDYTGAKEGITWRVQDAKRAGIHPLYALGAPGIGTSAHKSNATMSEGIREAGATIGDYPIKKEMQKLALERHEHELLESKARTAKDMATAALEAQKMQDMKNAGKDTMDMFRQVRDNNPNSETYGKLIWLPHESIAESLEGVGALGATAYGNIQGPPQMKSNPLDLAIPWWMKKIIEKMHGRKIKKRR